MVFLLLEDKRSTSHFCGQHVKVRSIHSKRPVLVTMQVQTRFLGILIRVKYRLLSLKVSNVLSAVGL